MINDFFAPVVKTLFIPEGNPGVQEVREIRAVPRVIQADGDAKEITVTGEMDLSISYLPINDKDDEIPWRTIQFTEKNDLAQFENEEQVISRLESALKHDDTEDEEISEDQWLQIDISVPFTLAIGTEGFCRDHIVKLEPCIHSTNWFLVGPKAIEFEALLQLAPQAEAEEIKAKDVEQILMPGVGQMREENLAEEVIETEEHIIESFIEEEQRAEKQIEEGIIKEPEAVLQKETEAELQPIKQEDAIKQETIKQQEVLKQQKSVENQETKEFKPNYQSLNQEEKQQEMKPKLKSPVQRDLKPVKSQTTNSETKTGEERHRFLVEKGYFQLKFYRVQLGEDLDAIADKFGISRDRISAYNSINEEDIRTGLLLSIPRC